MEWEPGDQERIVATSAPLAPAGATESATEAGATEPATEAGATESAAVRPALRIGVLSLQGDFAAHRAALATGRCEVRDVRRPGQLDEVEGLVLPGGESTTLLRLLALEKMDEAILRLHARGGQLFGTCAGLILLSREVRGPSQASLGLLDVSVERNGFGRQRESFIDRGRLEWPGRAAEEIEMVFIRAPRIRSVGPGVEVLATWRDEPVLVRQGPILGATFHPELTSGGLIHRRWTESITPLGQ